MANKTKKRQYNSNLSKKLAKLLDISLKNAMICDAITRVVGIDLVRAELDKMTKERHVNGPKENRSTPSGDSPVYNGNAGPTDEANGQEATNGTGGTEQG